MQQPQGSRSGRQTGAGHTPNIARTVVTASAEADVSTRKTFHNRNVHPQPLLADTSNGNTVCNYVFLVLATLTAETLTLLLHFYASQILRMRLKSNTLDFKIYILWLNTALRRLPPVSTHAFLLLLLVLPGNQYSDSGMTVRTAVLRGVNRICMMKLTRIVLEVHCCRRWGFP